MADDALNADIEKLIAQYGAETVLNKLKAVKPVIDTIQNKGEQKASPAAVKDKCTKRPRKRKSLDQDISTGQASSKLSSSEDELILGKEAASQSVIPGDVSAIVEESRQSGRVPQDQVALYSKKDKTSVSVDKKAFSKPFSRKNRKSDDKKSTQSKEQDSSKICFSEDELINQNIRKKKNISVKDPVVASVERRRYSSSSDHSSGYAPENEKLFTERKKRSSLKSHNTDKSGNKRKSVYSPSSKKSITLVSKEAETLTSPAESIDINSLKDSYSPKPVKEITSVSVEDVSIPSLLQETSISCVTESSNIFSKRSLSPIPVLSPGKKRKQGNEDVTPKVDCLSSSNLNEKKKNTCMENERRTCVVLLNRLSPQHCNVAVAKPEVKSKSNQMRPMPKSAKEKYSQLKLKMTIKPSESKKSKAEASDSKEAKLPSKSPDLDQNKPSESKKSKAEASDSKGAKLPSKSPDLDQNKPSEFRKSEGVAKASDSRATKVPAKAAELKENRPSELKKSERAVEASGSKETRVPSKAREVKELKAHSNEIDSKQHKVQTKVLGNKRFTAKSRGLEIGQDSNQTLGRKILKTASNASATEEHSVFNKEPLSKDHSAPANKEPTEEHNFLLPAPPKLMSKSKSRTTADFSDDFRNFHAHKAEKSKVDPLEKYKMEDNDLDFEEDDDDVDAISIYAESNILKEFKFVEEDDLLQNEDDKHSVASFGSSTSRLSPCDMDICVSGNATPEAEKNPKTQVSQAFETNVSVPLFKEPVIGVPVENYEEHVPLIDSVYNSEKIHQRDPMFPAGTELSLEKNRPSQKRDIIDLNETENANGVSSSSNKIVGLKEQSGDRRSKIEFENYGSIYGLEMLEKDEVVTQKSDQRTDSISTGSVIPSQASSKQAPEQVITSWPSGHNYPASQGPSNISTTSFKNSASASVNPSVFDQNYSNQQSLPESQVKQRVTGLLKTPPKRIGNQRDTRKIIGHPTTPSEYPIHPNPRPPLLPTPVNQPVMITNRPRERSTPDSKDCPSVLPFPGHTSSVSNATSKSGKEDTEVDHVKLSKSDTDLRVLGADNYGMAGSVPFHDVKELEYLKRFCSEFLKTGKCMKKNCLLHELPEMRAVVSPRDRSYMVRMFNAMIFEYGYWMESKLPQEVQELGNENQKRLLLAISNRLWKKLTEGETPKNYSNLWKHVADALSACGLSPNEVVKNILSSMENPCKEKESLRTNFYVTQAIDNMLEVLYDTYVENQDSIWEGLKAVTIKDYQIPEKVLREVLRGVLKYDTVNDIPVCNYLLNMPKEWRPKKPVEFEIFDLILKLASKLSIESPEDCTKLLNHFKIGPKELSRSNVITSLSKAKTRKSTQRFRLQCSNNSTVDSQNTVETFVEGQDSHNFTDISSSNNHPEESDAPIGSILRKEKNFVSEIQEASCTTRTREEEVTSSTEEIQIAHTSDLVPSIEKVNQPKPAFRDNISIKIESGSKRIVLSDPEITNTANPVPPIKQVLSTQSKKQQLDTKPAKKTKKVATLISKKIREVPSVSSLIEKKMMGRLARVLIELEPELARKVIDQIYNKFEMLKIEEKYSLYKQLHTAVKVHWSNRDDHILSKTCMSTLGFRLVKDFMSESLWKEADDIFSIAFQLIQSDELEFSEAAVALMKVQLDFYNKGLHCAFAFMLKLGILKKEMCWTLSPLEDDVVKRDEVAEIVLEKCMELQELDVAQNLFKEMLNFKESYRKYNVASKFYDKVLRSLIKAKRVKAAFDLFSWAHSNHKLLPNEGSCRSLCIQIPVLPQEVQMRLSPLIVFLMEQQPYKNAIPKNIQAGQRVIVTLPSIWFSCEVRCLMRYFLNTHIANWPLSLNFPDIVINIQEACVPQEDSSKSLVPFGLQDINPSLSTMKDTVVQVLKDLYLFNQNSKFIGNSITLDRVLVNEYAEQRRKFVQTNQHSQSRTPPMQGQNMTTAFVPPAQWPASIGRETQRLQSDGYYPQNDTGYPQPENVGWQQQAPYPMQNQPHATGPPPYNSAHNPHPPASTHGFQEQRWPQSFQRGGGRGNWGRGHSFYNRGPRPVRQYR